MLASNKGRGKAAAHLKWPRWIEAGMKVVDVGRKIFYLFSSSAGGTSDVVDISFVQGWFCSRVLIEDLFFDMPHEKTRIIRSQTTPNNLYKLQRGIRHQMSYLKEGLHRRDKTTPGRSIQRALTFNTTKQHWSSCRSTLCITRTRLYRYAGVCEPLWLPRYPK